MRLRNTSLALCGLIVTCSTSGQDGTDPESSGEAKIPPAVSERGMQGELEAIYQTWKKAMRAKDFETWKTVTARSRQIEVRNEIVSRKLKFPDALFSGPIQAPPTEGLILLDVLVRPATASMIFFGKADFGLGAGVQVAENIIVLRYQKESNKWLFDNLRVVKVGPEILAQIRNRRFEFLEAEEFQPLPDLPELPQPVSVPDYVAMIQVTSVGFESEIEVNGRRVGTIENRHGRNLLVGGLRRGTNSIKVTPKRIKNTTGAPDRIEVGIYAAETMEKDARRVFHYLPKRAEQMRQEVDTTFSVLK